MGVQLRGMRRDEARREKENDLHEFADDGIGANQLMELLDEMLRACEQVLPVDVDVHGVAEFTGVEMQVIAVDGHQIHRREEEEVVQIGAHEPSTIVAGHLDGEGRHDGTKKGRHGRQTNIQHVKKRVLLQTAFDWLAI